MARKRIEHGFHITRAELDVDRLSAIIERKPLFSAEQKRAMLTAHAGLTQPTEATDLLVGKFRRAGKRIGVDGAEIGTIGRYHYWRNCLYFSDQIETVFAEAAYYMHAFDGVKVGDFRRKYRVISAKITETPTSISRRYALEDLICHGHPLQRLVEDTAMENGWPIVLAPNARRDGHRSVIIYDVTKIVSVADLERVEMAYNGRSPSVSWNSKLIERNAFVVRMTLH